MTCQKHGQYISQLFKVSNMELWSPCPLCIEEEKKQEDQKYREEIGRYRLTQSGVPARYMNRDFDSFEYYGSDEEQKMQKKALSAVIYYAEHFDKAMAGGKNLLLTGWTGTGKSHLASILLQKVLSKGFSGKFIEYTEYYDLLKRSFNNSSETVKQPEELASFDLLILDEIGVEIKEYSLQILFRIINKRNQNFKPTVLISNFQINDFDNFFGDRVADRLLENSIHIPFQWKSYRRRAK